MTAQRDLYVDTRQRFWRRLRNSVLQAPWLWSLVIKEADYEAILDPKPRAKSRFAILGRIMRRVLWFWPRLVDAETWAQADLGAYRDPAHFRVLSEEARILLDEVAARTAGPDDAILDLGCNCGRHLNNLDERGFKNLSGVEIGSQPIKYMDEWFPGLRDRATVHHDTFQRFLSRCGSGAFDLTYSHGATLEVVHPSFPLVRHICRVTRRHVVLLIQEFSHEHTRLWTWEFERNGFHLVKLLRPVDQIMSNPRKEVSQSLMVFRRGEQGSGSR